MRIISSYKWLSKYIIITLCFAAGLYYYFHVYSTSDTAAATSFYVVETVERGSVSSGIQTTGDIVAAQKLDIDVYKQLSRIDVVNVSNGTHVEAGAVLFSFDKSDAYVDTQSARVAVAEAALTLQTETENSTDPNTAIRSLENQIAGYKQLIVDTQYDLETAYRDFLNTDLEVTTNISTLRGRTEPVLTGRYAHDTEGYYTIEVYASGADSGYSFRVNGLESLSSAVVFNKAVPVGTRGLSITFPSDTKAGDIWIISIPNSSIATYAETKKAYELKVASLEKTITDTTIAIANAEQELSHLKASDTSEHRDLAVEKAATALAEAEQRLATNYDIIQERDIVAPFAGTVEGMENVVAGATPTGGSDDSINLGTLISDEFLTTFTLSATDVAKVTVGQKVIVTITSFSEQPVFEAAITQISSLPASDGVAQYEVQALLDYNRSDATTVLREGMLANIEIVEEEKTDTLRIPTSAITYEQGVPKVTVIDTLTDDQKAEVARMGIVRTNEVPLATYTVTVELGIIGQYYAEVVSGLETGDIIIGSALTETSTESVVEQAGFGPGGGQRPSGSSNAAPTP